MERYFTAEEVKTFITRSRYYKKDERVTGEARHQNRIQSVVEVDGVDYLFTWYKDLTVMKQHRYEDQTAKAVKKVEWQETINKSKWIPVNSQEDPNDN